MSYIDPVIWDIVPDSKTLANFSVFKNKIKKWKTENCPCKTYIYRLDVTKALAPVSWTRLRYFSSNYLYKCELVFKFTFHDYH